MYCSGIIQASHVCGPGSTPGMRNSLFGFSSLALFPRMSTTKTIAMANALIDYIYCDDVGKGDGSSNEDDDGYDMRDDGHGDGNMMLVMIAMEMRW